MMSSYLQTHSLIQQKLEFNDVNNNDGLLDIQNNQLPSRVEYLIQHQHVISETTPCEKSSYFPLPKELKNPLINIQSNDNE